MSLSEIEKLYSPSVWNKRMSADTVVEKFCQFLASESERIRQIIPCELNVAYSSGSEHKFDIYGTHLKNDVPVFIFIHGGYWQENSKTISANMAEMLATNNIRTIIIGFNLCPNISVQNQVTEVGLGINKCLELTKKWGSRKVALCGHSSGAHIIASLLNNIPNDGQIQHIFLISGIFDVEPIVDTYINEALNLTKAEAENVSPVHYDVHIHHMHIFCIVAQYDSPAFLKDSENYYKKLITTDNHVEFILIENVDHFNIIENLSNNDFKLSKIIVGILNRI